MKKKIERRKEKKSRNPVGKLQGPEECCISAFVILSPVRKI